MKTSFLLRRLLAAACIAGFLSASDALAQTLPGGQYQGEAELGPVYLDGRYPLFLDDPTAGFAGVVARAGFAELTTSPTGALGGSVLLLGRGEEVIGQITSRVKGIKLSLRGKADEGSFSMKAVLKGGVFIGTATMRGKRTAARLEVTGVGPIRAIYEVTLASAGSGAVTGTGTVTVARTAVPVTAKGRVAKGKGTLALTGGKTFLRTSTGALEGVNFTAAKWTAQGFGALLAGRHFTLVSE